MTTMGQLWYLRLVFAKSIKVLLFVFTMSLLWPTRSAYAYEDQLTLGLEAGYGNRYADEGPHHSALFGITTSVGLDDILSMRGRLTYLAYPSKKFLHQFIGSIDLLYLIDIMEIVPYFGGGLDLIADVADKNLSLNYGIHGVFGLDYHLSWEWIISFELRPFINISALKTEPALITANLGASYIFDL